MPLTQFSLQSTIIYDAHVESAEKSLRGETIRTPNTFRWMINEINDVGYTLNTCFCQK
jgi:hypothetical protein